MKVKYFVYALFLVCFMIGGQPGALSVLVPASAQIVDAGPYVTTITVNSTLDPDSSGSTTCTSTPCTLRRAIVQARSLGASARPVLIKFDIPVSDPGYDSVNKVWIFDEFKVSTIELSTIFRSLTGGSITIDGSTQPNGRTNGPKIILVGPGTGSNLALNLSSGIHNTIRGIAFQNWKDSITITSSESTIEDCWFGLDVAGMKPAWRDDSDPKQGSGANGVVLLAGGSNNLIQNNVFLGLNGTAATIRNDGNTFKNNKVGTTYKGTTPGKTTDPILLCTEWDWYGGSGIRIDGDDHIIEGNMITGIRLDLFSSSTQPEAIYVGESCDRVIIRENLIGLDALGNDRGVCGRGINVFNSKQLHIENNTITNPFNSAILLNGTLYRDGEISKNVIRKSTPWLWPEGAPKGDDAIVRFTALPDSFEFFNPAKITSISGTAVVGTAGDGSPCPNCRIEIFMDDNDGINEALQYLGSATANAAGKWTFTLPSPLKAGQGLRTTSTTTTPNIISGYGPNTTVGLSELYIPVLRIYLPMITK